MSEESDLPADIEDLDLPRIVVEDDRILVFPSRDDPDGSEENYWAEKNVKLELIEDAEDEKKSVDDDLVLGDEVLGKVLEDIVGASAPVAQEKGFGLEEDDSYRVGSSGKYFYDSELYDSGSSGEKVDVGYVKVDVGVIGELEEKRRGRSMLEIAGFRDEEAEKRRKEKRERFWER